MIAFRIVALAMLDAASYPCTRAPLLVALMPPSGTTSGGDPQLQAGGILRLPVLPLHRFVHVCVCVYVCMCVCVYVC